MTGRCGCLCHDLRAARGKAFRLRSDPDANVRCRCRRTPVGAKWRSAARVGVTASSSAGARCPEVARPQCYRITPPTTGPTWIAPEGGRAIDSSQTVVSTYIPGGSAQLAVTLPAPSARNNPASQ